MAKKLMPICLLVLASLATTSGTIAQEAVQETVMDPRVRVVTNAGEFVMRLDANRAPLTVAAFLATVESGFYEGTIFHRVIAGFVAQAGGFTPDMQMKPTEGAVYNESGNGLSNIRGTVGLARTNDPHSGTTQFYINLADNLDLNPRPSRWGYAVFGIVEEGMEVIDNIGHSPTTGMGSFERNVPVTPIIIQQVEVLSN